MVVHKDALYYITFYLLFSITYVHTYVYMYIFWVCKRKAADRKRPGEREVGMSQMPQGAGLAVGKKPHALSLLILDSKHT